jgi:hypothetical protein
MLGGASMASHREVSQHKNKPCHNAFGLMKVRFSVIKSFLLPPVAFVFRIACRITDFEL